MIGKLGGHLGRKSDGPPGPKSIWRGLTRVVDFAAGWKASRADFEKYSIPGSRRVKRPAAFDVPGWHLNFPRSKRS